MLRPVHRGADVGAGSSRTDRRLPPTWQRARQVAVGLRSTRRAAGTLHNNIIGKSRGACCAHRCTTSDTGLVLLMTEGRGLDSRRSTLWAQHEQEVRPCTRSSGQGWNPTKKVGVPPPTPCLTRKNARPATAATVRRVSCNRIGRKPASAVNLANFRLSVSGRYGRPRSSTNG